MSLVSSSLEVGKAQAVAGSPRQKINHERAVQKAPRSHARHPECTVHVSNIG